MKNDEWKRRQHHAATIWRVIRTWESPLQSLWQSYIHGYVVEPVVCKIVPKTLLEYDVTLTKLSSRFDHFGRCSIYSRNNSQRNKDVNSTWYRWSDWGQWRTILLLCQWPLVSNEMWKSNNKSEKALIDKHSAVLNRVGVVESQISRNTTDQSNTSTSNLGLRNYCKLAWYSRYW